MLTKTINIWEKAGVIWKVVVIIATIGSFAGAILMVKSVIISPEKEKFDRVWREIKATEIEKRHLDPSYLISESIEILRLAPKIESGWATRQFESRVERLVKAHKLNGELLNEHYKPLARCIRDESCLPGEYLKEVCDEVSDRFMSRNSLTNYIVNISPSSGSPFTYNMGEILRMCLQEKSEYED